jgi:hypothetical protein
VELPIFFSLPVQFPLRFRYRRRHPLKICRPARMLVSVVINLCPKWALNIETGIYKEFYILSNRNTSSFHEIPVKFLSNSFYILQCPLRGQMNLLPPFLRNFLIRIETRVLIWRGKLQSNLNVIDQNLCPK